MAKETCLHGKKGLFALEKRCTDTVTPQVCVKRDLFVSVTRDLFVWQKRPINMEKETCLHGKRGLFA